MLLLQPSAMMKGMLCVLSTNREPVACCCVHEKTYARAVKEVTEYAEAAHPGAAAHL
ncbi:hypothetical protein CCHOA_02550 [Corynebacterium choanae]|uniref:Uncharacterized protein n=1 Tax=Corynebacterium choanae TaxID=1862358 RepID=A0A3G6J4H1_9CORY|nr:hypothetical protein CCHOA_02550 [Corynebacterium choanae]